MPINCWRRLRRAQAAAGGCRCGSCTAGRRSVREAADCAAWPLGCPRTADTSWSPFRCRNHSLIMQRQRPDSAVLRQAGALSSAGAHTTMDAQEQLLRDLIASGACPALNASLQQADPGSSSSSAEQLAALPFPELLAGLRRLPFTTYSGAYAAACLELLAAQRAGDTAAATPLAARLCGELPSDWCVTSGTSGASKFFPFTPMCQQRMISAVRLEAGESRWSRLLRNFPAPVAGGGEPPPGWRPRMLRLALTGRCEELPGGGLVGSLSSVIYNRCSRAGIDVDADQGVSLACQPAQFLWLTSQAGCSAAQRYYHLWLMAAADPGLDQVAFLSDIFAGNLLTAISVLQQQWRDMVDDLRQGALLPVRASKLPAAVVDCVNGYLAAAPDGAAAAGAQHLQTVMSSQAAGGSRLPLLQQLMPRLHAVFVVITGGHSKFWPVLRQLLAPGMPVCTTFYGGTEGTYAHNVQLLLPGRYDSSACADPTQQQYAVTPSGTCFFEFIPVDSDDAEQQQQQQQAQPVGLTLAQLVTGRCYELVVTGFSGLCRFRVGDVVCVDGWLPYDATTGMAAGPPAVGGAASCVCGAVPIISFVGRAGCALNLVWEKYDEAQLLKAVRDTCTTLAAASHAPSAGASSDGTTSSGASSAFPGLAEFTVQECIEDEAAKHYAFFWELQQPHAAPAADVAAAVGAASLAAWEAVLNRCLAACNEVYAGLLAAGQIAPARIRLVSAGSFGALRDSVVDTRRISPSQFKMPTVVAPGSTLCRFLQSRVVQLVAVQQQQQP